MAEKLSVEKIVPNIHAAFVRIADGQKCYLPLNDVKNPVYTRKLSKKEALCEGDELLVQVVKDAVKTKDPVVSTKLVVHGHYCFLSTENTCLGVSKKLSQEESKRRRAQGMVLRHRAQQPVNTGTVALFLREQAGGDMDDDVVVH